MGYRCGSGSVAYREGWLPETMGLGVGIDVPEGGVAGGAEEGVFVAGG